MPAPMMSPAMPKPATTQFSSNAPGGGAQLSGYNTGLQNLQKSLGLSNQTTQAGQMQLGQQLQQNQAAVNQNMASRGLGNSSISQTMSQAPLQTYNTGMAQLGDLSALRQMGAFGNLAQAQMQGGNQVSQYAAPYAQSGYLQNLQQSMQPQMLGTVGSMSAPRPGGFGGIMSQQGNPANPNMSGFNDPNGAGAQLLRLQMMGGMGGLAPGNI